MHSTLSIEQTNRDSQLVPLHWQQLWSLSALYASIIVGWIAYQNYQPKLLIQFQFTEFSFLLLVVQGLVLTITPIIAGKLGDRFRFKAGHRLPIITSGTAFAAMIFMAVAFTLLADPGGIFKWVLPVLIVGWLIAMSIFTSPALSTLELFTPVERLPHAMALLTIVSNLVYSLEPVIVDIIDFLGAPITFIVGGLAVFTSGYALKTTSLSLFSQSGGKEATAFKLDTQRSNYRLIFILGLALGTATTLLFYFFPAVLDKIISTPVFGMSGNWMLTSMLLMSAVMSIPISSFIRNYGLEKSFWLSVAFTGASALGVVFIASPIPLIVVTVVFAFSFTLLSLSSLPLAIRSANYYEKVYCVGIFFSGAALPEGIVQAWLAL